VKGFFFGAAFTATPLSTMHLHCAQVTTTTTGGRQEVPLATAVLRQLSAARHSNGAFAMISRRISPLLTSFARAIPAINGYSVKNDSR